MSYLRRRTFITLLGGAAASPLLLGDAARAQQPAMPVIGYLGNGSVSSGPHLKEAFHKGLSEIGYVESQNVAVIYRWAEGQYDRFPALAADLVSRQVSLIAAPTIPAALAARSATATIPIIFNGGFDPVEAGLISSLSRPGGNVTGVTNMNVELGPKRLELLNEMVPAAKMIAVLINPSNPNADAQWRDLQAASGTRGLQVQLVNASSERDFATVFAKIAQLGAGGLLIGADAFFNSRYAQLAALALHHAVPTIFQYREFAAASGLMSYGGSITDAHRQVGVYVGRILEGEKPADLPVMQTTKVELIINLKTAKALGITVPLALLGRADELIE